MPELSTDAGLSGTPDAVVASADADQQGLTAPGEATPESSPEPGTVTPEAVSTEPLTLDSEIPDRIAPESLRKHADSWRRDAREWQPSHKFVEENGGLDTLRMLMPAAQALKGAKFDPAQFMDAVASARPAAAEAIRQHIGSADTAKVREQVTTEVFGGPVTQAQIDEFNQFRLGKGNEEAEPEYISKDEDGIERSESEKARLRSQWNDNKAMKKLLADNTKQREQAQKQQEQARLQAESNKREQYLKGDGTPQNPGFLSRALAPMDKMIADYGFAPTATDTPEERADKDAMRLMFAGAIQSYFENTPGPAAEFAEAIKYVHENSFNLSETKVRVLQAHVSKAAKLMADKWLGPRNTALAATNGAIKQQVQSDRPALNGGAAPSPAPKTNGQPREGTHHIFNVDDMNAEIRATTQRRQSGV